MFRFFAAVVLSVTPLAASAQTAPAGNPCPACLTYYHNPEGKTNLMIFYTYSTATDVLVQVSCSPDDKTFTVKSLDKLDTEGRNQRYLLSYDVSGCKSTRVVVAGSRDANSADVVTVQAVGQTIEETLPVQ
jgi:hypothetical protein